MQSQEQITSHGSAKEVNKLRSGAKTALEWIDKILGKETNIEKYEEGEKLAELHDIPGSPFRATKEKGEWFITMGMYRLTNNLGSKKACMEYAKNADWDLFMTVIQTMIEADRKVQEEIKSNK